MESAHWVGREARELWTKPEPKVSGWMWGHIRREPGARQVSVPEGSGWGGCGGATRAHKGHQTWWALGVLLAVFPGQLCGLHGEGAWRVQLQGGAHLPAGLSPSPQRIWSLHHTCGPLLRGPYCGSKGMLGGNSVLNLVLGGAEAL